MNNKGFTMVELIATIALLSVIMVISFVSINTIVDNSKINECRSLISNIKSATKEYFSDKRYDLISLSGYKVSGNDKKYAIDASILMNDNYLTGKIFNPFDDEEINGADVKIAVELNNNYMIKEIIIKNLADNEVICDNEEW